MSSIMWGTLIKILKKIYHNCTLNQDFDTILILFYGGAIQNKNLNCYGKMINDWNIASNTWLQKLYYLRKKWCPVFSHSTFTEDIKSTQRSESINRVFSEMSYKTMSISEFAKHYEQRTIVMCDIEATEDYKFRRDPKIFIEDYEIL